MTYQVLSLKWRPQTFSDVVGQNHVTHTLKNAFIKERIAQGYVFTGARGVGKTTMARLMAKGLNCENPVDHEPCNECNNCNEITDSRSLDVLEIDGASNRGIDEIRNIRENIKFPPMNGKYKVYIIDEVHMLTTQAFNALLRTLEEPPAHGKFIMCTTDIHKLPATIISRCQRYDFNRINSSVISLRMEHILKEEKISFDNESISAISRKADGSMRDALSILDQVISFSGESIKFDEISTVLGLIPYDLYFQLTDTLKEKNGEQLVSCMEQIRSLGTPLEDVVNGLNQHLRNLLICNVKGAELSLDVNLELKERYIHKAAEWDSRDLIRFANVFGQLEQTIGRAAQPQIMLEMNLLKMLEFDRSVKIESLLESSKPTSSSTKKVTHEITESKIEQKISTEKKIVNSLDEPKKEVTKKPTATKIQNKKDGLKLNLDEIKTQWNQMVTEISKVKTSVAMVMEHSMPLQLKNRKLEVGVFDQPQFSFDRLERNTPLIESTFKEIFGQDIRIIFLLNEEMESDIKHEVSEAPEIVTKGDPIVNKVIEVFDGEIIR